MGRKIVVYERVSTDKQDITRQALQRQRATTDHPAAEIVVLQDDGVSAYKVPIFDRPNGGALCDLIATGDVEAVYVDAQDRLSRGADDEWIAFRTLCDANDTWIVVDGQRITRDLGGKAISYLRALLARQESDEKSHRVRTGKAAAAAKGRPNGGPRRFGFDRADGSWVPRPDEVAVAEKMYDLARGGTSQTEIARTLNEQGHRTAGGHAWSQPKVGQVLRDPIWIGKLVNQAGTFQIMEPVIDPDLWHAVQRTFGHSGARRGKPSERFLLSHGLLRCGHCGSAMRVKSERKEYGPYDHYSCSGRRSGATDCKQPAVRREYVDKAVLEYFKVVALDVDGTIAQLAGERERRLADVDQRLAVVRKVERDAQRQQERLDDLLRDGLTLDEWRRVSAIPQQEAEAAAGAIADLTAERDGIVATGVAMTDATSEFVERIAALRAAVAGEIVDADGIAATQAALRRVFDGFELYRWDAPNAPRTVNIELGLGGGYLLHPMIKADPMPVTLPLPDSGAIKASAR